jgi:hypothetical protein
MRLDSSYFLLVVFLTRWPNAQIALNFVSIRGVDCHTFRPVGRRQDRVPKCSQGLADNGEDRCFVIDHQNCLAAIGIVGEAKKMVRCLPNHAFLGVRRKEGHEAR